jgi:undecaprenyl-diphosphatase
MKYKKNYQLCASFGLVLFVLLGYLVKFFPSRLSGFDHQIQEIVRGELSDTGISFFVFLTQFGGDIYVAVGLMAVVIFLIAKQWYAEAIFLSGLLGAIIALVYSLKAVYGRLRPSLSHLVDESGLSFPSGHASISIVFYGFLMLLICQRLYRRQVKWAVRVLLGILIALIGISRIYLGVHYPTDVLAGWLLGGSLLLLVYPFYDEVRFKWRFKGGQK